MRDETLFPMPEADCCRDLSHLAGMIPDHDREILERLPEEDFPACVFWLLAFHQRPADMSGLKQAALEIFADPAEGLVTVDEILGRARRRHGVKLTNSVKSFIAAWLVRILPEEQAKRIETGDRNAAMALLRLGWSPTGEECDADGE
jgi:hypothetical protein